MESCNGAPCTGDDIEIQPCNLDSCPGMKINIGIKLNLTSCIFLVDCVWDAWAEWEDCVVITDSSVIGRGIQTRRRVILIEESNGGGACIGDDEESQFCFCEPTTDCAWSEWGAWECCDHTSGDIQVRSRTIETPATCGGAECTGDSEEERPCPGEGDNCQENCDCQENLLCDGNKKVCRVTCYPTIALPPASDPKWDFCLPDNWLCQEGEGDCDNDDQCEGDLICAFEMCPNTRQSKTGPDVDCCGQGPTSVAVTATDLIEVFDNDS